MKNEAATIQETAADKHSKILPLSMAIEETSMRKKMQQTMQMLMPRKRLKNNEEVMKHLRLHLKLQTLECKLEQRTRLKAVAEGRTECHAMLERRPKLTCQMNGANGT